MIPDDVHDQRIRQHVGGEELQQFGPNLFGRAGGSPATGLLGHELQRIDPGIGPGDDLPEADGTFDGRMARLVGELDIESERLGVIEQLAHPGDSPFAPFGHIVVAGFDIRDAEDRPVLAIDGFQEGTVGEVVAVSVEETAGIVGRILRNRLLVPHENVAVNHELVEAHAHEVLQIALGLIDRVGGYVHREVHVLPDTPPPDIGTDPHVGMVERRQIGPFGASDARDVEQEAHPFEQRMESVGHRDRISAVYGDPVAVLAPIAEAPVVDRRIALQPDPAVSFEFRPGNGRRE